MSANMKRLVDAGLADRAFTERDLSRILDGTPASRYAIVNKAIKKDDLIKLRRGLYLLANKYQTIKPSLFYIASMMVPYSYISLETALSYFGWIPEKVISIMSITARGRARSFRIKMGEFIYQTVPINNYEFLNGVLRKEVHGKPFLIASPLRALSDYAYLHKIDPGDIGFLVDGLRIEYSELYRINKKSFFEMKKVYRNKRVLCFLNNLQRELKK